jgi:hypothetical protein
MDQMVQRRQLSTAEKDEVLRKHGRICFVTGHTIPDGAPVEFHHIRPFTGEGPTTTDNIAPVCRDHHRRIGTLSLTEFRDKLQMESYFSSEKRLDDVLAFKVKQFGKPVKVGLQHNGSTVTLTYFDETSQELAVHKDPATGWKFFYTHVPTHSLANDAELQPRPIEVGRLWLLYNHLRSNAQLAASVARIDDERILLFDGQHKAAAQIWLGRRAVECKVYLDADARALKETNLTAHEKLRQMPFYTSTLMRKYGDLFGEDWQEYVSTPGVKSETGFVDFLMSKGKKRAEANKELRFAIYKDVLESVDPANRLKEYIEEENRARENPLSTNLVQKTFFHEFITPPPLNVEFESPNDYRAEERRNLVKLLNMIVQESLDGKWNPEANDAGHKKASRIYLSGAVRGWVPMLKDAVAQVLRLFDSDQRERILLRSISEDEFTLIHGRTERLFSHKVWLDPDPNIDNQLKINEPKLTKQFLNGNGLTTGWILGSEQV